MGLFLEWVELKESNNGLAAKREVMDKVLGMRLLDGVSVEKIAQWLVEQGHIKEGDPKRSLRRTFKNLGITGSNVSGIKSTGREAKDVRNEKKRMMRKMMKKG